MKALALACLALLSLRAQPTPHRFTLPNGLRVIHLEDHERPLVRVLLHLDLDPAATPPSHHGLPQLAMRMIDHSDAGNMKPDEFQRLLETSGIQWSSGLGPRGLEWRMLARSRDQDRALGLLADRLLRTILDPQILETERLATWRAEEFEQNSLHTLFHEALAPGSRPWPTAASLGAISFEDLLGFRDQVFRPDHAVLILHGDLGLEQAKRLVLLNLGSWTSPKPPATPTTAAPHASAAITPAQPPPALQVNVLRIPAGGPGLQVQAVARKPVDLRPETASLLILLLSEDPVMVPVRVLAQGPPLVATLLASVGASGQDTWRLLHSRLETIRQRGFTPDDLDRAKAAWLARRSLDNLHPDTLLDTALDEALGLEVAAERLQATSLDTLNAGLKLWLDPANIRSGAMGDAESLKALPAP